MDVVTLTHNSGKTLRRCLESIEREIPNPRIIIVDRYSTDNTVQIAREFNCEIYFEDKGVGYARQLAYSKCETEWIVDVDSDVVLHKNWYNDMIRFIEDDVGAIEALSVLTCFPEYIIGLYRKGYREEFENMKIYRELKKKDRGTTGHTLIRKEAIKDLKIPNVKTWEDFIISNHVLERGYRWIFVPVLCDHIATLTHALRKERRTGAGERIVGNVTFSDMLVYLYRNSIMCVLETFRLKSLDPFKFRFMFPLNLLIGYIFSNKYYPSLPYMKR